MNNFYKLILALSLFGIISIVLVFNQINMDKSSNIEIHDEELYFYKMNFEANINNAKVRVADVECYNMGDTVNISELASNGPVLIYRCSDIHCSSCVDNELAILKKYFLNYPEKVNILCWYEHESYANTFIRSNLLKFPFYKTPIRTLSLDKDLYDRPYYFVLCPNMDIKNIFIPDSNFPELSALYLENMKKMIISE